MSFCYRVDGKTEYVNTKVKKKPPPFGLKVFKGFKNVILRRDFVRFVITHPIAKAFRIFLQDTNIPDEHFYATLSRITNIEEFNDKNNK